MVNGQIEIQQLFVDGTEGVPAFRAGDTFMPMFGADMERVEQLKPVAQTMATQLGKDIHLYRFDGPRQLAGTYHSDRRTENGS